VRLRIAGWLDSSTVSPRALVASALVVVALIVVGMWAFDLPFQNAVVLAPVFMLSIAAIAFLAILWGKVVYESLRRPRS
jgi:hypothetical protein